MNTQTGRVARQSTEEADLQVANLRTGTGGVGVVLLACRGAAGDERQNGDAPEHPCELLPQGWNPPPSEIRVDPPPPGGDRAPDQTVYHDLGWDVIPTGAEV
ncbi:hypothetical protein QEZ54_31040, partial [Catellatospora sp. KI3]|uniref:hypothetical protein n=1 Tax=Catellatospora sp. KI3 TaxID=3041620 RepID=UPI002482F1C8